MPIGVVNDDDFFKELSRSTPSSAHDRVSSVQTPEVLPAIEPLHPQGRRSGDMNVPDSLRQIIGEEAVINGRKAALKIADEFGVSHSSVSAYTRGATSTATINTPKQSIISHINKSRARASKKAGKVLSAALEAITQDKLDYADATDLSGIAKDMSVIIKNLEPPPASQEVDGTTRPQFVIFAPTFKDERSYDTITVQE